LLDSLSFLSEDVFRAGLKQLLGEIFEEEGIAKPIALYPVRPPPKFPDYVEPAPKRPYAEDDGSEHIVANVITEVVKAHEGRDVVGLASPEQLRERKFRTVLLVDDYTGSGNSVLRYLDRWWENRTVKSWRSYGLIRFIVVTYACSPMARTALLRHRLLDDLRWVEFGFDFESARWSSEERASIRELCLRYATNKSLALGHKRSEGLLVLAHTVPNNLPQILRHGKPLVEPWFGFFPPGPRRLSAGQVVALARYRPDSFEALDADSLSLTQERLAASVEGKPLLQLLAALARAPRTDDRLMRDLALTVFELKNLLTFAHRLGLLDERRHLTDAGHVELHHAKLREKHVGFQLRGSSAPYYPQALRGARGI
jgi:hypothetical protein